MPRRNAPETVTIAQGNARNLHQPTRFCLVQASKRTFFVAEFGGGTNLSQGFGSLRIYSGGKYDTEEMFPIIQVSRRTKNLSHTYAMSVLASLWAGDPIPEEFLPDEAN